MRPFLPLVIVVSGLLLVGAALLGWQALGVRHDISSARADLNATHVAANKGDLAAARTHLQEAAKAAADARSRTDGLLWRSYAHLPVSGPVVQELRGLVDVSSDVTSSVLPPLVAATPEGGRWNGKANLTTLASLSHRLAAADVTVTTASAQLAGLPHGHIGRVSQARAQLSLALQSLTVDVHEASVMTTVLPSLLGADHPGRVLVVAQNNAEERATGGLIGAYAMLTTDSGSFALAQSGSNIDLQDARAAVVDLGPDFTRRYGRAEATATWRSANLTPDVPSAGAILAGLSARQLHMPVDGVVLIDPVGLADLLRATGPVVIGAGHKLTADNAVRLLLHDVYEVYPGLAENAARDAVFQQALKAVVRRLQEPGIALGPLVESFRRATSTGHLQVFVSHPRAEALLRTTATGGALPDRGPFLSVVTQDVGGSKLDYYLRRAVTYVGHPSPFAVDLGAGPEDVEDATITVRLTNTAPPSGLPPYVTTRADRPEGATAPVGQLRSWVSVYLGPRASYSAATVDGRPVALSSDVEGGLTVLSTYVSIDPGKSVDLVLKVNQPSGMGQPLVWRQEPRLLPDQLRIVRRGAAVPVRSYYAPRP